jgi:hypothetical protein
MSLKTRLSVCQLARVHLDSDSGKTSLTLTHYDNDQLKTTEYTWARASPMCTAGSTEFGSFR